jgi:signal transduction histidine kinase
MAHELGNPLNAIGGHLQLLQRELVPMELHRHLAIIRAEIDRMVTIIQHILESTRLQVRPAPVDINKVVQEVGGLLSPTLFRNRVVLKTDLADSLPPVAGDHRTLHGVIFNLATNAIQAMPDGGELEITTSPCIDERAETTAFFQGPRLEEGAVRLTMCDSGCGIPPENLNRIFKPFFTTRHHEGGTGLGLAICHRVVLSLGGRIGVASVIGHGTRFFVDLPPWVDTDEGGSFHED